jgi:inorganic pyrophosphatase
MRLASELALLHAQNDKAVSTLKRHGLTIVIEVPKGKIREYKDDAGKTVYKRLMSAHYGYIKGTRGRDGDGIDCFVGPMSNAKEIYVVHMRDQGPIKSEREDEDKIMIGFISADAAKACFIRHYAENFYQSMTAMPVKEFKKILKRSQTPYLHNMLHAKVGSAMSG